MVARIALCQMRVHPGEPERNAQAILGHIEAHRGKADLLVFPELCVPGYFLGDAWERSAFLRDCEEWNRRIVGATARGPAVVFGTVAVDWDAKGEDGRPRKFNAWIAGADGKAVEHPGLKRPYGVKTLLPNYREFEDARHFWDARKLAQEAGRRWEDFVEPAPLTLGGEDFRVGVLLCEDAWEDDYAQKPIEALAAKRPDFTLNLSASPFTRGKNDKRNRVFAAKAARLGSPLLYVNCTGLQNNGKTIYTFDGSSTVYGGDGAVRLQVPAFEERVCVVGISKDLGLELEVGANTENTASRSGSNPNLPPFSTAETHRALRYGLEKFLGTTGCRKVVVGLSGGIDSAVAAALYREFLNPDELLLINMPSRFNSSVTRSLARRIAENLGCLYAEIPIEPGLEVSVRQLDAAEVSSVDGSMRAQLRLGKAAFENVQARDRGGRILAAAAAAFGGVFSCNVNKAELTVGYGTLYGDLTGFLAPLGDLWKSDVYALGRHLNSAVYGREILPAEIFDLIPSAELSVDQAVEEGKGDPLVYPYHDRLFFAWVQRWDRATPEDILSWYEEGSLAVRLDLPVEVDLARLFPTPAAFIADLERWWNLYNGIGPVKRVQAPPILALSSRAFGYDHREFLGGAVYTERYKIVKKRLLGIAD